MNEPRIVGAMPPEDDGPRTYPVIYPAPGQVVDYTLVGPSIVGVPLHWDAAARQGRGRSVLCTLCLGRCEGHDRGWSPRWAGYVAAYDHGEYVGGVLTVRKQSAAALLSMAPPLGTLRGMRVTANRPSVKRRGDILWVQSSSRPLTPLPHEVCILATLSRMYNCDMGEVLGRLAEGGAQ